jgi:NADPH2:quinone reductase
MVSGRALCFGNFDLVGVILAYVDEESLPSVGNFVPVPVPRFNPPTTEVGREVHTHLLQLLAAGAIRPVIGNVIPLEELARALDEMESRSTVGRTVVTR